MSDKKPNLLTHEQLEAERLEDERVRKERKAMPLCPVCGERPQQPHGWCDTCRTS